MDNITSKLTCIRKKLENSDSTIIFLHAPKQLQKPYPVMPPFEFNLSTWKFQGQRAEIGNVAIDLQDMSQRGMFLKVKRVVCNKKYCMVQF